MEEKNNYKGKIRIFAEKEAVNQIWDKGYVAIKYEYFDDCLVSDIKEEDWKDNAGELDFELGQCGVDSFSPSIQEALKDYGIGDIVEIVADAYLDYYFSYDHETGCTDCEPQGWLKNIRHRKLDEYQIKVFINQDIIIFINKSPYRVPQEIGGQELYNIGGINSSYDLWKEEYNGEDTYIEDNKNKVNLYEYDHLYSVRKDINGG